MNGEKKMVLNIYVTDDSFSFINFCPPLKYSLSPFDTNKFVYSIQSLNVNNVIATITT